MSAAPFGETTRRPISSLGVHWSTPRERDCRRHTRKLGMILALLIPDITEFLGTLLLTAGRNRTDEIGGLSPGGFTLTQGQFLSDRYGLIAKIVYDSSRR